MNLPQHIINELSIWAQELRLPSVIYKPKLYIDGTKWCALYGDNLQDGVAGFGDTPEEAMQDFNNNWINQRIITGA